MKNIETPDKIHLQKLIDDLKEGSFVIPNFQRQFEWEPWDVVDLVKSIFMDYYVGTLLLWKAGTKNRDSLKCESIYGFKGDEKPQHIVLDGQQRLTALYYTFFAPEKSFPRRKNRCYIFVKIKELLEENYDDAFFYEWENKRVKQIISDKELQFKKKLFPLSIIGNGPYALMDWIREYKQFHTINTLKRDVGDKEARALEYLFRDLLSNYYISYIELDREIPITKVCDIFTKINSTGLSLNIFDLLNAILTPKEIYLKQMWLKDQVKLGFIDESKMKIYVLQVISILLQSYCSPRYLYYLVPGNKKTIKLDNGTNKQIVLIKDKDSFLKKWNESITTIQKTITALKNPRDFGAIIPNFVPYPSIIPALAAIKHYVEVNDLIGKGHINDKIKKWYWSSVFTKRYSSSVESQSAKDFKDLQKWFKNDELIPEAVYQFKNDYKYIDLLRETKKGAAIYNAIFNLIILKRAKDWSTFEFPEYSSLDDHHIVPQSWGKKKIGRDINSILNRTPLSKETNRTIINDELPNKYLKKMMKNNGKERTYKILATHLISRRATDILLRDNFGKEDFYEFIEERKRTIIKAIEEIILNKSEKFKINYSELIEQGEGQNVEFKETFNFDVALESEKKERKFDVIKAITGFLNSNGGKLLIGVSDDGTVRGLERDYEISFNKNKDGFLQNFRSSLNKQFNDGIINRHIDYSIIKLDKKEILVIDVEKSREPIILKVKINGTKEKVLYVRRGNKTDPIIDSEEMHQYLLDNWNL